MKTRHALLTFVFLPAITWGSNINESMIQEDRIWFYQYKLSVNPELGDMFRYSEMTLRGDTLIDGAKYKKVLSREVTESREPIGDWQTDFLCLNDTNGKIFMYDERSKSRWQLLDLTAEEGESVTGFSLPWIVSEVKDTIFSYSSDLSVRHSLSVTTTDEPNRTDIWVEGIGSLTYGIMDYSNFEGSSVVLLSCIQGSEVLYMHRKDKCTTPTIAYAGSKLVFNCETPGAKCAYEIKCTDAVSGRGGEVILGQTYEIRVHATLDGYEDSDVAVATIGWRNGRPVMEGFSSVTMDGGDGNADVNGDGKVDVADIATVISVMAGQQPE